MQQCSLSPRRISFREKTKDKCHPHRVGGFDALISARTASARNGTGLRYVIDSIGSGRKHII